jgi:hypothetical protein
VALSRRVGGFGAAFMALRATRPENGGSGKTPMQIFLDSPPLAREKRTVRESA